MAIRRVHHNRAARIKSESIEAKSREAAVLSRSMAWRHENDLFVSRRFWQQGAKACQHGYDKTESSWDRSLRCRDDLMKCGAGQTAVRQVAIKCGQAERKAGMQGLGPSGLPRQQKAQFGQDGSSSYGERER